MCKTLIIFLFLIPAALLRALSSGGECGTRPEGPVPDWVIPHEVPLELAEVNFPQTNLHYLITDIQTSCPDQATYCHYAVKALTQTGVSLLGQFDIEFSPSYQEVIMHTMRVYRNGCWTDRLHTARHSLLQRESELESDVYEGVFTLVYFLPDIREGDIVDYAFSLVGEVPYFAERVADEIDLQLPVSFERCYRRLLANSQLDVRYKLFEGAPEPKIVDLSSTLREWSWELSEMPAYEDDVESPSWYIPYPRAQFSDYAAWKEVIDWLLPIYSFPEDLLYASSEMCAQVEQWIEQTDSSSERALLAVRFVQDQVRYLGFEDGINGFKPSDPRFVFERRFGDCKDKTFLLSALLRMMGISSTPVLVHSNQGKNLPTLLPTPFAFNHAILRIELDSQEFWIDSTFTLQGGSSLQEIFLPIYHWGLPISNQDEGLVPIVGNFRETPTKIDTSVVILSEDAVQMTTTTTYEGHKADYIRRYLDTRGAHNYSEAIMGFFQRVYGSARIDTPLEVIDSREKNVLSLVESYQLPISKVRKQKVFKVYPATIRNYLDSGLNPERSSPYSLIYPLWVEETVRIENRIMQWEAESDAHHYETDVFKYAHTLEINDNIFEASFMLRHLQDHVPVDELRAYWEMTTEIEQDGYFYVPVTLSREDAA